MKFSPLLILALAAFGMFANSTQADLFIRSETGTIYETTGITTFGTTGEDMAGLQVSVTFVDLITEQNSTESVVWERSGLAGSGSGGAFGDDWGISLGPGTSWSNPFTVLHSRADSIITEFTLKGAPADVIFDRTFNGDEGTTTSARGKDILESGTSISTAQDITATYFDAIQFTGSVPVGDLFAAVNISFSGGLAQNSAFGFVTDTDTGSTDLTKSGAVPEPTSFLIFGSLGLGFAIFRKKRADQSPE
ncbi:MAG: PEP-CTERM sorting domain-containing protein [Mariniblastus sp.]|nr:PEP-CTERM sorting domain-containing protein [Mariniblastus sp.]